MPGPCFPYCESAERFPLKQYSGPVLVCGYARPTVFVPEPWPEESAAMTCVW